MRKLGRMTAGQTRDSASVVDLLQTDKQKLVPLPCSQPVSAVRRAGRWKQSRSKLRASEYLICISDRIHEYDQYPFEGRADVLGQVMESISQGHSVLVVGEAGIGKRTLSLGLARTFAALRQSSDDPLAIYSRSVYTLSLGASFWDRVDEDVLDIQHNICEVFRLIEQEGPDKLVLCIDDIDVLSFIDRLCKEKRQTDVASPHAPRDGTGDGLNSAENLLRQLLINKRVLCLCTCILPSYQHLIDSDSYYDVKFTMSFRVLHMKEPDVVQTLQILRAHRKRIEKQHGVTINDDTLYAATAYADTYISHQAMPKKALELVHEACKSAIKDHARARSESEELTGSMLIDGFSSESDSGASSNTTAIVQKCYVDEQIREWCRMSDKQLKACLENYRTKMPRDHCA